MTPKAILRRELKSRLKAMTSHSKLTESAFVQAELLKNEKYLAAKYISVYVSMSEEVDTKQIIENALLSNKSLYVPYFNKVDMFMVKIKSIDDYNSLPFDTFGVRQPKDWKEREHAIDTTGLDLIVCPGLGFNLKGHRIGRGRGYYDKYLKKYKEKWSSFPHTIGIGFSVQEVSDVPMSEHDVPLNSVILGKK